MLTLWYLSLNSVFSFALRMVSDRQHGGGCCFCSEMLQSNSVMPASQHSRRGRGQRSHFGQALQFCSEGGEDRNDGMLQNPQHELVSMPPPTPARVTSPKHCCGYAGAVPLPLPKPTGSIGHVPVTSALWVKCGNYAGSPATPVLAPEI